MQSFPIALLVALSVFVGNIAVADEKQRAVPIFYSIEKLSGNTDEGSGMSFLYSREKRLFVTAYHVLPETYPALKNGLRVDGANAILKCSWPEADLAVLQADSISANVVELRLHPNPSAGLEYLSDMTSRHFMFFAVPNDPAGRIVLIGGESSIRGKVILKSEGQIKERGENLIPTGARFLVTDTPGKTGFSGGPAYLATNQDVVIGIQQLASATGSFGLLSSSENILELLKRKECQ